MFTVDKWMDDILHNDLKQATFSFPDPDLMKELVDLYFFHINTFTPVLHRPTFEASLDSGLHHRDPNFGGVVLLVCALASRFSHDRRVLVDGEENWHSAGWNWFTQVKMYSDACILKPTSPLYALQTICVRLRCGVSMQVN